MIPIVVECCRVGSVTVLVNASSSPEVDANCDVKTAFLQIHVEKSKTLHAISDAVGWIYMVIA
jgi:hypothetical protein